VSVRVTALPPRGIASASLAAATALAAASLLLACGAPADEVVQARVAAYFDAVQSEDPARVAELLVACADASAGGAGGAGGAACAEEVARRLADVAAQRAAGEYRFDDAWGLGLVRAFVLGRGGYWTVVRLEVVGDEAELVLELRTQYRAAESRGLPHDAVIEYLARPLGHVEKVPRGGEGPGSLRWQLDVLEAGMRLRRVAAPGGEPEWRVDSFRPLPETAQFSQVTWRPR